MAEMGLFYTSFEIAHLERRGDLRIVPDALVDTGSEYTWIPRPLLASLGVAAERRQGFIVADGRSLERDIGYALVRAAGAEAPDLVVFAEPGDMVLLGSHSLEGLNLKIDPVRKALVPAGPVIAARAAAERTSASGATPPSSSRGSAILVPGTSQGGIMTREALVAQLLRLPPEERAHLARVLIESLDEQPELDSAWLEEAERRAAELAAGTVRAVPGETAVANARRRLAG